MDNNPKEFDGLGERIWNLFDNSGMSMEEFSNRAGMSFENCHDLGSDNELPRHSLKEGLRVASALGTSLRELLRPGQSSNLYISFEILADMLRAIMANESLSMEELEDKVGWRLHDFFANPNSGLNEDLWFLTDVCKAVRVDWIEAVPLQESGQLEGR